jgi:hypothetical protein
MEYFIACECGKRNRVAACQAGEQIHCKCGQSIRVPALSELRKQAGAQPFERSGDSIVAARYGKGRLVVGNGACLSCASATNSTLACVIECESPGSRDRPFLIEIIERAVVQLAIGWFQLLVHRPSDTQDAVGHERVCEVRVSICPSCRKLARRPSNLRRLLMNEAEFVDLFREYPLAQISVMDSPTS